MNPDLSSNVVLDESGLATYLHAHEAGSHAGEGVAKRLLGRDDLDAAAKAFLREFVVQIRVERAHVTSLLERLESDQSLVRRAFQAAATVADMVGRVAALPAPRPFSDLEALAIGVWGKRLLWGALIELSDVDERIAKLPLAELTDQAERQEIELLRIRSDAIVPSLTAKRS
ncbi:MAG TPA: hypothetical protein VJ736_07150 [Actinomycetota bacterium]|jgi:hypothetical protein|nr:hypothetical protein [Actinomycetota bacterium]